MQELCDAGMACARLNFSHVTDYSEPAAKMELVRAARGEHAKLEGRSTTLDLDMRISERCYWIRRARKYEPALSQETPTRSS